MRIEDNPRQRRRCLTATGVETRVGGHEKHAPRSCWTADGTTAQLGKACACIVVAVFVPVAGGLSELGDAVGKQGTNKFTWAFPSAPKGNRITASVEKSIVIVGLVFESGKPETDFN